MLLQILTHGCYSNREVAVEDGLLECEWRMRAHVNSLFRLARASFVVTFEPTSKSNAGHIASVVWLEPNTGASHGTGEVRIVGQD